MKRLASILILAVTAPAWALVSVDVTNGWLKQPVATKGVADRSAVIPPKEDSGIKETVDPDEIDITPSFSLDAWQKGGKLAGKPVDDGRV